jgi:hypothetical protein
MTASAAAERALSWLATAWDSRDADDARLAVDALALAAVCRLLVEPAEETMLMTGAIEDGIARAVPEPAWTGTGLLAGLLAAGAAVARGDRLAENAGAYLRALAALDYGDAVDTNGVLLRLALSGEEGISFRAPDGLFRLRGGKEDVRRFLADVEMGSGFGTAKLATCEPDGTLLHGAAVAAFRAYDLPLGMRLLRAANYVSAPPRPMPLAFVRASQCDNGSFGDYDTPLARLRERGEPNAELRLRLPVALQALWTLGEAESPDFRLVRVGFAACRAALLSPEFDQ